MTCWSALARTEKPIADEIVPIRTTTAQSAMMEAIIPFFKSKHVEMMEPAINGTLATKPQSRDSRKVPDEVNRLVDRCNTC
jgi:hypothetical protein